MKNDNRAPRPDTGEQTPDAVYTSTLNRSLRTLEITVFAFLVIITVVFIWSNSFDSVDASLDKSGHVTGLVTPFLEIFLGKGNVTEHIVRKLAHFCEFAALGFEVCSLAVLVLRRRAYVTSALFCLTVAAIDESIQIFTGRGPSLRDVLIDFGGAALGILIIAATLGIARGIKRHKSNTGMRKEKS